MISLKSGGSGFLNTKFLSSGSDIYLTGSNLLFDTSKGIDSLNLGGTLYIGNINASTVSIGNGGSIAINGVLAATSPIFTTSTITPLIIGGSNTTSTLTLRTTSGVGTTNADMILQVGNNGATEAMRILNAGNITINGATATRQVTLLQDTAFMSFGSRISNTGEWCIYGNQTTPTANNFFTSGTSAVTKINGNPELDLTCNGLTKIQLLANTITCTTSATAAGAFTNFTLTNPAHTGQTLSTEIPSFLITTTSRQWATGAISTQREVRITSPTYSFVGASTITSAYTLHVAAPTASTNATITNNFAIGMDGNLSLGTAGNGIYIKEGSNATMGTATANGATEVTVSTTKVTATSRIQLTCQAPGGTPSGIYYVSSRSAGTSFGFKSVALDTSTVGWIIFEPAP